jgi:hypothetical protein
MCIDIQEFFTAAATKFCEEGVAWEVFAQRLVMAFVLLGCDFWKKKWMLHQTNDGEAFSLLMNFPKANSHLVPVDMLQLRAIALNLDPPAKEHLDTLKRLRICASSIATRKVDDSKPGPRKKAKVAVVASKPPVFSAKPRFIKLAQIMFYWRSLGADAHLFQGNVASHKLGGGKPRLKKKPKPKKNIEAVELVLAEAALKASKPVGPNMFPRVHPKSFAVVAVQDEIEDIEEVEEDALPKLKENNKRTRQDDDVVVIQAPAIKPKPKPKQPQPETDASALLGSLKWAPRAIGTWQWQDNDGRHDPAQGKIRIARNGPDIILRHNEHQGRITDMSMLYGTQVRVMWQGKPPGEAQHEWIDLEAAGWFRIESK